MGDYDSYLVNLCVMNGADFGKPDLDSGGRCILPTFVMAELSRRRTPFPIMFELSFSHNGKSCHLGVNEFTAPEGCAVVPDWVMKKFHCRKHAHVQFRTVMLPLGNFIRIRPMEKAFIELADPKFIFQDALQRKFTCLTQDDVIDIHYNGKVYKIHVMEVRARAYPKVPAVKFVSENVGAVTELIVEFERPANMPASPVKQETKAFPAVAQPINFELKHGVDQFVGGVAPGVGRMVNPVFSDKKPGEGFSAFQGAAKTISGKPVGSVAAADGAQPAAAAAEGAAQKLGSKATAPENKPQTVGHTMSGKTVVIDDKKPKEDSSSKPKEEDAAAAVRAAFAGAGRTLGGGNRRPPTLNVAAIQANTKAGENEEQQQSKDAAMKMPQQPMAHTLRGQAVPAPVGGQEWTSPSSTVQTPVNPVSPANPAVGELQKDKKDDDTFRAFQGNGKKLK